MIIFTFVTFNIGWVVYFITSLKIENVDYSLFEILALGTSSQILILSVVGYCFNLIRCINGQSKTNSMANDLLYLQLFYILFILFLIGMGLQLVRINFVTDIDFMLILLFTIFLSYFLISNYVKIVILLILEVYVIAYTISRKDYLNFYQWLYIQFILIMNIIWTQVQQGIIVRSYAERGERSELSFKTMHDLRNYVYSYIELNEVESSNNLTKLSKKSISNIHDKSLPAEVFERLEESLDMDKREAYYQQKFIIFKICFLYHMELIYENGYNVNAKYVDVKALLFKVGETLKILFMNKNNSLVFNLHAKVSQIQVDTNVFEYLIVDLANFFHDLHIEDLIFDFSIDYGGVAVQLLIKIKLDNVNMQILQEFKNRNSFQKLIHALNIHAKSSVEFGDEYIDLIINLPMSTRKYNYIMRKAKKNQILNSPGIKRKSRISTVQSFIVYEESWIIKKMEKTFKTVDKKAVKNQSKKLSNLDDYLTVEKSEISDIIVELKKTSTIESNNTPDNKPFEKRISATESVKKQSTLTKQDMLKELMKDYTPVTYTKDDDNLIYINTDDEENILRMNSRIFKKEGLVLNCVKTGAELHNMLYQVYLDFMYEDKRPTIMAVMDHMLDREYGYEAVATAQQINLMMELEITFVLLSSTEDKETLSKYTDLGIVHTVAKPLNRGKLSPVLAKFKESMNIVTFETV